MRKRYWRFLTITVFITSIILGGGSVVGTRANDDTPGTAQTIALGDTKTDTLTEGADNWDWYVADIPGNKLVRANLTGPGSADFDLTVFDQNQTILTYSWSYDSNEECIWGTTYSGNYYINVSCWEGAGSYDLKLFDEGAYVDDGNNDLDNATEISVGDTHTEDLDKDAADTQDWFKAYINSGKIIAVNLTVPGTGDYQLVVIDPDRKPIGSSNDGGTGEYEEVTFGTYDTGYYYIGVGAVEGSGSYDLKLIQSGTFSPDHDNDPGNASTINIGGSKRGSVIDEIDDSDWYDISLISGDKIVVDLEVPDTGDLDVYLYSDPEWWSDAAGLREGYGTDERFGYEAEESGTYYLKVSAREGEGDYTLSVNRYRHDNNDALEDAEELKLPLSEPVEGELLYGLDDADYYKVYLKEEDFVHPILDYNETAAFDLHINSSAGEELALSNSTSGHEEINFTCEAEGWYYLFVDRIWGTSFYTLDIEFVPGNNPPFITSATPSEFNLTINENKSKPFIFDIDVTDEKPGKLEYVWKVDGEVQKDAIGDSLVFATNYVGRFSAGKYVIEVEVTDEEGLSTILTWNVTVQDVNQKPYFKEVTPLLDEVTMNETESLRFEIDVDDIDDFAPEIQWYLDGEELDGEDGDHYEFETDYESEGEYEIKVVLTDGDEESVTNETSWTVEVLDKDRPPELKGPDSLGSAETDEESDLEFNIDATDPDGDDVTYEWYFDGELVRTAVTGSYTFIPDYESADGEVHEVRVAVTSGELTVNQTWQLNIVNVNRLPEIDESSFGIVDLESGTMVKEEDIIAGEMTHKESSTVEFYIEAEDPDGEDLEYNWVIERAGQPPVTSQDQYFALELDAGTYTVTVTVEDDSGGSDTYTITFNVPKKDRPSTPGFGPGLAVIALVGITAGLYAVRSFGKRN